MDKILKSQSKRLKKYLESKYDTTLYAVENHGGFYDAGMLLVIYSISKKETFSIYQNMKYQVDFALKNRDLILNKNIFNKNQSPLSNFLYYLASHLPKEGVNIEIYEESEFEGLHYIVMNDYATIIESI